jgi:hypothetical protein
MFWMDVRSEPLVLGVPEMEPNRFYNFQLTRSAKPAASAD